MKPAAFAYAKASSLASAMELLGTEPDSKILAGGQSLIATLNMRLDTPRLLVDINGLSELNVISATNGSLEIGAMVRQCDAEKSAEIARHAPLVAMALPHIAHPAIRNRGTIGGSIAYADPAAELPACIVALNGELEIAGRAGKRMVKADDFFTGLFDTDLAPGEVLTKIRIPAASPSHRFGFAELARRHGDYALVGLAAAARIDGAELSDVRLVYFGVGVIPMRARNAERALAEDTVDAAISALPDDIDPKGDVHASAAARLHLAGVLLKRIAAQLYGRAA
ncbi:MAG: FAD binding domain-containing protein [Xanthobacteraceae bacterium]